jgi:hypothetical protein
VTKEREDRSRPSEEDRWREIDGSASSGARRFRVQHLGTPSREVAR